MLRLGITLLCCLLLGIVPAFGQNAKAIAPTPPANSSATVASPPAVVPSESPYGLDTLRLGQPWPKGQTGRDPVLELEYAYWADILAGNDEKALLRVVELAKYDMPALSLYLDEGNYLLSRPAAWRQFISAMTNIRQHSRDWNVVAKAQDFLAMNTARHSDPDAVREILRPLGFVADFLIIGPFENDRKAGIDTTYPPEEEIAPEKSYDGNRGKVSWTKLAHIDADFSVPLGNILYPDTWSCAYAATFIQSSVEQTISVRIGADDAFKLWLNQALILQDDLAKGAALDQFIALAKLHPGWNTLLIKSCQESGKWEFRLRLTKPDGAPLEQISISSTPPPAATSPQETTPGATTNPTLGQPEQLPATRLPIQQWCSAQLQKNPDDISALFYLGLWNLQNNLPEYAIIHLEHLIKLRPSASLYQTILSEAYFHDDKPTNAVKTLRKALEIDPANLYAHFRLGRYYRDEKQYDRAMSELNMALEKNPDFWQSRLELAMIYNQKDWRQDALLTLNQLLTGLAENSALGLFLLSQTWRDQFDPERELIYLYKTMQLDPTFHKGKAQLSIAERLLSQGNIEGALAMYQEVRRYFPYDSSFILDMADILASRDRFEEALALVQTGQEICQRCPAYQEKLGDLTYRQGHKLEAINHYEEALRYDPENLSLREYRDFLAGSGERFYEHYQLSEPELRGIIEKAPGLKEYPKASALTLLNLEVYEVFKDGSSVQFVHRIQKILDKKGREDLGTVYIGHEAKLLKAITHTPQGETIESTSVDNGTIHFPKLVENSVIEYKYLRESYGGGWLKEHFYLHKYIQGDYPIEWSRIILTIPKSRNLKIALTGSHISQQKSEQKDNIVYTWEAKKLEQIFWEVNRVPWQDISEKIFVTTVPSWEYLTHWQNSLIKDQFKVDAAIRDKVTELTTGKPDVIGKIQAIYDFLVKQIRYDANDVGIFGKKPNKSVNIFANRFGDCKDISTLMITMLGEIGIKAYYAAVRTNDMGRISQDIPSPQTNHIITFIPKQAGIAEDFFVDGTTNEMGFQYLRQDDQDIDAMILMGNDYTYKRVPILPAEKNGVAKEESLEISPDNPAPVITTNMKIYGTYAAKMRSVFMVEGRQQEFLELVHNQKLSGVKIRQAKFSDLKDLNDPVLLDYSWTLPGLLEREGQDIRINLPPLPLFGLFTFSEKYAPTQERIYDCRFPPPEFHSSETRIKIPGGYTVGQLPQPLAIKTQSLLYSSTYRLENGTIVAKRAFTFLVQDLPKSLYNEMRDLVIKIDEHGMQAITLKKTE
jgi:tetratricopeptide (TPR) repeat protein